MGFSRFFLCKIIIKDITYYFSHEGPEKPHPLGLSYKPSLGRRPGALHPAWMTSLFAGNWQSLFFLSEYQWFYCHLCYVIISWAKSSVRLTWKNARTFFLISILAKCLLVFLYHIIWVGFSSQIKLPAAWGIGLYLLSLLNSPSCPQCPEQCPAQSRCSKKWWSVVRTWLEVRGAETPCARPSSIMLRGQQRFCSATATTAATQSRYILILFYQTRENFLETVLIYLPWKHHCGNFEV